MSEPVQAIEPRWPVALAVIALLSLLALLPDCLRVLPTLVPGLLVITLIAPMVALHLTRAKARWLRIEMVATLLFVVIVAFTIVIGLGELFFKMLHSSDELTGLQLLTSSVAVWLTNVLVFSVMYWRIDQGGPEARANCARMKPDWQFPQQGAIDGVPPDWRPTFADYLFLSYCTATAFSPTGDLPLTSRAKLLMMMESTVSLVTIIVVAARAINILGS